MTTDPAQIYDAFIARRLASAQALAALAALLDEAGLGAQPALQAAAARASSGRFVVALVGAFSSGKSTLLNALLGQPVLPAKVNPCTALVTELVYGEQPSVTLHHRAAPGEQARAEPITIEAFAEQWQLGAEEAQAAGAALADRFGHLSHATLAWPLDLLKHGITLLDTPGLDDDAVRTARTLARLPEADAAVVVLSAPRFLSALERDVLAHQLGPLGLDTLFFPTTMVDLLSALSAEPEQERAALQQRAEATLAPLVTPAPLDTRFFLLDARGALNARWDRAANAPRQPINEAALASSGLLGFERALARFLTVERGGTQLRQLAGLGDRARHALRHHEALSEAASLATLAELEARLVVLRPRVADLAARAARAGALVDELVAEQQAHAYRLLRARLAACEAALPEALAAADLSGLGGVDLLVPAGRERVLARLRTHLDQWLTQSLAGWHEDLEAPLQASLTALRDELDAEAEAFDAEVAAIERSLIGVAPTLELPPEDRHGPGAAERWFGVAVGALLLSPGTAAAAWNEGFEGALKGAAARLGVRLAVVGLAAAVGPVGWAGLALYALSDAALLLLTGGGQLRRLRRRVADDLQGKLVARADAARPALDAAIAEALAPVREAVVDAVTAEAYALTQRLDGLVSARAQADSDAEAAATRRSVRLASADAHVAALHASAHDAHDAT